MAFVNEFIPDEDVEKYHLKEIDEKFFVGQTNSRQWTIDRERDIYLRNVARGAGADPDFRNQTTWTFYWKGDPLTVRLDLMEGRGERGGPGWSHWKMIWVNGSNGLPAHLKNHKNQILDTLKEALLAYKDFGVYSSSSSYSITMDIAEECVL